jgi:hypothetical protein
MRRLEAIGSGVSEVGDHLIAFGNLQQEEPRFGVPKPIGNHARILGAL